MLEIQVAHPLSCWVAAARVGGGWGERGPVGFVGGEGCLHCVVDVEDGALGAVVAVSLLVLAADDGEGVQDVGDGVRAGWGSGA